MRPVVEEDLLVVGRDVGVVDDDSGVAVLEDACAGPVLAADQDAGPVDDDAFVVDIVLEFDGVDDVDAESLELFEESGGLELAHDDFHVDAGCVPISDDVDELLEGGCGLGRCLGELDVLELQVEGALGAGDQFGDGSDVVAGVGVSSGVMVIGAVIVVAGKKDLYGGVVVEGGSGGNRGGPGSWVGRWWVWAVVRSCRR